MRNKSRILMIVENEPAPVDSRVWPEAIALRDSGFQVSVIGPKGAVNHRASHEIIDALAFASPSIPRTIRSRIHRKPSPAPRSNAGR